MSLLRRFLVVGVLLGLAGGLLAANAGGAPTTTITVVFSSDATTATITSGKGISHYQVKLCDGRIFKVELTTEQRTRTIGPFASQIVSVTVKAGQTVSEFESGVDCGGKQPPPPQPPPDPGPKK